MKFLNTPYTHSTQKGTKGNCFVAQVFDCRGKDIARISVTENEADASDRAKLFAAAPELLEALLLAAEVVVQFRRLQWGISPGCDTSAIETIGSRVLLAIEKATGC